MKNLIAALYKAKLEFPTIKKDMNNPFFKRKYADINSILDQVEPILHNHGIIILQPIDEDSVCTQLIHVESGEMITSCIKLTSGIKAQDLGSEITYFRRYSLQSLLSLQAEDDDGNLASGRVTPAAQQTQAPRPAPSAKPAAKNDEAMATAGQIGEMGALWSVIREKSPKSLSGIVERFGFSSERKFEHLTFNEAIECLNSLDSLMKKIQ
jgi:hypothetical protein